MTYTTTTSTLTIPAGQTSGSIAILVLGDTLYEPNEMFQVTLSNPINAAIANATGNATIVDNDPIPTIAFTTVSQSVNEGALVTATLQLSAVSGMNTNVPFTVSGTATTSGTDYSNMTVSPVTIAAGSSSGTVTFKTHLDAVADDGETVVLTLGVPTYATLGVIAAHTVTVNNLLLTPIVLPKTGQTTSYAAGDDGALQVGKAWPSPRFIDNGNGTVTDNLSGLIWLKNADCFGIKSINQATADANNLESGMCNLSDGSSKGDWKLPSVKEFFSLIDSTVASPPLTTGHPFVNVNNTTYALGTVPSDPQMSAWGFYMSVGELMSAWGGAGGGYVWPVRGNLPSFPVTVSRFRDIGDGTVLDNFTSLTWMKNASCFGYMHWSDALSKVSDLNNGAASCSGYTGGHTDWRLPNILELESLVDYGSYNPYILTGHPFVNLIQGGSHWSSTTDMQNTSMTAGSTAHSVQFYGGMSVLGHHGKDGDLHVWPVRGGQ